jgi:hypothetical protein
LGALTRSAEGLQRISSQEIRLCDVVVVVGKSIFSGLGVLTTLMAFHNKAANRFGREKERTEKMTSLNAHKHKYFLSALHEG